MRENQISQSKEVVTRNENPYEGLEDIRTRLTGLLGEIEEIFASATQVAQRDSLTGLERREVLEKEMLKYEGEVHSKACGQEVSLIIVDLDHFKSINDQYGHPMGDAVLKEVGLRLRKLSENKGFRCARLGGEEFAVYGQGLASELVYEHAERIRLELEQKDIFGISVTASLGVGLSQLEGFSWKTFYEKVDKALYSAKSAGRNQVIRAA